MYEIKHFFTRVIKLNPTKNQNLINVAIYLFLINNPNWKITYAFLKLIAEDNKFLGKGSFATQQVS